LKNTVPEKTMKVKLLVVLLIFGGAMYWQDSTSDDKMDKYIEEYKQFQAKADSVTELADSLKEEIIIADNESRAAESRAKLLGRQVNSLQKETIDAQGTQVTELESALSSKDNALRMAMMRGDSLQAVINLIPPAPKNPNRMFGFKLPSRKASFLVGVAMGVGAGVLVIK
jgi:hypothetical protein